MKKNTFFKSFLLLSSVAVLTTSCEDDPIDTNSGDYTTVLTDLTTQVIVSTYSDLDSKAENLHMDVMTFKNDPTQSNLETARDAWIQTREPWEQSEGFLFGPVDTDGIDPALDSWPVNQVDLDNVLASSDNLTSSYVNLLEGTLKGFHTIEYLLWGADGTKAVEDFTEREYEYLTATCFVLNADANALYTSWESTEGDFASNLIDAGANSSIYISQKSVLEELANGIVGIADEVGNGKINDPLEQQDLSLEESQFSDNSKTDFTNNIRSIQNIYLGIDGQGLTNVVADEDSGLDAQIKAEIQASIDAIQEIPGTFTDAISNSSATHAAAVSAQTAVRTLQVTLESELIPLISNL